MPPALLSLPARGSGTIHRLSGMHLIFLVVLVLGLSWGRPSHAAGLWLDPDSGCAQALPSADFLRDPTGRWSIDEVLRRDDAFRPSAALVPSLHASILAPSTLWFRLRLHAVSGGPWYLHTTMEVDRAQLFFIAADGHIQRTDFGMLVPFNRRTLKEIGNVAVMTRSDGKAWQEPWTGTATFYLRVVTREDLFGGFSIHPAAWEATQGRERANGSLLPELVMIGMIGGLGLFYAILGLTLREPIYGRYAAAMLCFAVYIAAECGGAWVWLWPSAALPYDPTVYLFYLLYLGLIIGLAQAFCSLRLTQVRWWRAILVSYAAVCVIDTAYAAIPNLVDRAGLASLLDPASSTVLLLALLGSGIAAWRKRTVGAGCYSLAFAGTVAGIVVGTCGDYCIIPETAWTDAAPGLGVVWEAILLAVALAERIRRLRQERDSLANTVFLDLLTGIANRRGFEDRLAQEWRRALRAQTAIAIVMIDVDAFKAYNDMLGHPAGDRVLLRIANAISRSLRRGGDLVARYGGEEFIAILPHASHTVAATLAEAMRREVEQARIPHPASVAGWVTVSVGAASTVPTAEATPEHLIEQADQALYSAKAAGRNRVAIAACVLEAG